MIRITKLSDYALIILSELSTTNTMSAKELSLLTHVPYPTTNKILKILTPKITLSKGGKHGGYLLKDEPKNISLLLILQVMEGQNISMTECSSGNECLLHQVCKTKDKLNIIDKEIHALLSKKTLADII